MMSAPRSNYHNTFYDTCQNFFHTFYLYPREDSHERGLACDFPGYRYNLSILLTHIIMFTLPPLRYELDALAPYISRETLEFHHGKHHQTYVDNLNRLVPGTEHEGQSLEEIIMSSKG